MVMRVKTMMVEELVKSLYKEELFGDMLVEQEEAPHATYSHMHTHVLYMCLHTTHARTPCTCAHSGAMHACTCAHKCTHTYLHISLCAHGCTHAYANVCHAYGTASTPPCATASAA